MTEFGILLALVGPALAFWPWSVEPFTLSKVAVLLAGALLAHLGLALRGRGRSSTAWPALALVGAYVALSTIFSADPLRSLVGGRSSTGGYALSWLALGLAASAAIRSEISARALTRAAACAGAALGLYAVLQHAGVEPFFPQYAGNFGARAFSFMGGPVPLGAALAVCTPAALWLMLDDQEPAAAAWLGAAFLCWAGLIHSGTRAALGGAAVGCLYILVAQRMVTAWFASALAVLAVAAAVASRAGSLVSDMGRVEIWRIGLQLAAERPWLGWGLDVFEVASRRFLTAAYASSQNTQYSVPGNAHNALLQALACGGAVGAGLLGAAAWQLRRLRPAGAGAAAAGGALALACFSMANPVPLVALSMAAILVAPALRGAELLPARASSGAAAAACAVLLAAAGVLLQADVHAQRGYLALQQGDGFLAAVEFNRAAQLNPLSAAHVARQLDLLRMAAVNTSRPQAVAMLRPGLAIAERNARWHPADPLAAETLAAQQALTWLVLGEEASRGRAQKTIRQAAALAPTYPTMTTRARALERRL